MNRNQSTSIYCSPSRWERAAREEAIASNLDPVLLLSGKRSRPYSHARWRAWKRLAALGHSYKSIGTASGFDHTSVMYGCKPEKQVARRVPAAVPVLEAAE